MGFGSYVLATEDYKSGFQSPVNTAAWDAQAPYKVPGENISPLQGHCKNPHTEKKVTCN